MHASKGGVSAAIVVTLAAALAGGCLMAPFAEADERQAPMAPAEARSESVDIVRVDDGRIYQLREGDGLIVYDVSDPDRPRLIGHQAVRGWPLGFVTRSRVATIVMRGTDVPFGRGTVSGPATVRAVDFHDPSRPLVLGESAIEGIAIDARATESKLYVLSESRASTPARTIVTAFRLDGSDLLAPRTLHRDGAAGALRVVAGRIVLARGDVAGPGTHIDLLDDDETAGLTVRGSVQLASTMGREDADVSELLEASDPAHLHVLACRTALCAAGDPLDVVTINATEATHPRVVSSRTVRSPGGWLATRFDGNRLYLSRRGWLGLGAPSTPILNIDLDGSRSGQSQAQMAGAVVWNIVTNGAHLFVVGTRGNVEVTREQVVVDSFNLHEGGAPSLGAEALLGDGWAASPAQASSAAISVCGSRVAIPFRASAVGLSEPASAVALFDDTAHGLRRSRDVPVPGKVERVVCVRGRFLALSDAGIWSLDTTGTAERDMGSAVLAGPRNLNSP